MRTAMPASAASSSRTYVRRAGSTRYAPIIVSCSISSAPGPATANSPRLPLPPIDFASWATSGLPRRSAASAFQSSASPATVFAPSVAAQRPPSAAIAIGPSARSLGAPSSGATSIVSSTERSGTWPLYSSSSRWMTARSSNSAAKSRSRLRSGADPPFSIRPAGTATSCFIVASCFEIRASSACSVRFSLRLAPEISSTDSSTFSSDPNFWSSWAAVLSPMPGTPGMLSEVSPLSPIRSGTSSGGTP